MHDPMTVAFEIYLGPKKKKNGHYRDRFITIWHKDPESDGSDDSCGWAFPKISKEEGKLIGEIARSQYGQLFARTKAEMDGESYASICYDQDTFGIIYWLWRIFNKQFNNTVWQYGKDLSFKELQYILELSINPVDNFQHVERKSVRDFEQMVWLVYRCWKAYHRKWWQHPRWHIHHWRIQFHPWQKLKRRYWDKCCVCGKRGFKGQAFSSWGGDKKWHPECYDPSKNI